MLPERTQKNFMFHSQQEKRDTDNPKERLIVYGSLAPGEANHFLLASLTGEWYRCRIRGHMGHYRGFKSFRFDPQGPEHPAWLLESAELPRVISDLDDFEGEEYERITIPAQVNDRRIMAQVYEGKCID
jgi:gamma-glutamylcyclotransferase (GGCT)/AIG2-like uncharacterized protein YtfP